MYIHYTISEDRSGTADEVMSKRLAALTGDRHRSTNDKKQKKPHRKNAWGVEECESSADHNDEGKGPEDKPDRLLIEIQDIEDAMMTLQADLDYLETVQDRFTDTQIDVKRLSTINFPKCDRLDERIHRLKSDLEAGKPWDASELDRLERLMGDLKARSVALTQKAASQNSVNNTSLAKGSEKKHNGPRSNIWEETGAGIRMWTCCGCGNLNNGAITSDQCNVCAHRKGRTINCHCKFD
jgi:hypothetical protein